MAAGDAGCHDGQMVTTVLIVDDDPSFRALAREILEDEGFEVVGEAEDGASAMAAARERKPAVVLLDVQLPDISGFEACKSIRSQRPPPVVVLISSRDASDYGDSIADSGAHGFIAKAELSGQALSALLA